MTVGREIWAGVILAFLLSDFYGGDDITDEHDEVSYCVLLFSPWNFILLPTFLQAKKWTLQL